MYHIHFHILDGFAESSWKTRVFRDLLAFIICISLLLSTSGCASHRVVGLAEYQEDPKLHDYYIMSARTLQGELFHLARNDTAAVFTDSSLIAFLDNGQRAEILLADIQELRIAKDQELGPALVAAVAVIGLIAILANMFGAGSSQGPWILM